MQIRCFAVIGCALCLAASAQADRIDMYVFENADNADVSGLDLWVDVTDGGGGTIDFTFHNDSSIDSIVTDVYFEETAFAAMFGGAITFESAGVDFSDGASPPNPPGSISAFGGAWAGNLYSADSNAPVSHNGIAVGELLTISFTLDGVNVQDIIDALSSDPLGFRIAQHIQGLPQGASVWAVNTPIVVPLAPAAWMGLAGLGLLAARRLRRA